MKKTVRFISFLMAAAVMLSTVVFAIDTVKVQFGTVIGKGSIAVSYSDNGTTRVLTPASAGGDVPLQTALVITATPQAGYSLSELMVNGSVINSGDTVYATADVTVTAVFNQKSVAGDSAKVTGYQVAGSNAAFSAGSLSGVSITLQVYDPDFAIAGKSAIEGAALTFSGSSAFHGAIANKPVADESTHTYSIKLNNLTYDGKSDMLELLVKSADGKYNAKLSTSIKNAAVTPAQDKTEEPKPAETATPDAAKPYVIISNYSYGEGDLVAGESRNITLTLYNTSKNLNVENMIVSLNLPADSLVLTSSSNTFHIEKLEAGKSITRTVNVTVKPTATAEPHAMEVASNYEYIDGSARKSGTTTESISMPVVQKDRFTVTGVTLAPQINVGEESSVSVGYVNMGRGDLYNVTVQLNCEGLSNSGEQQYLGNLVSGATSSADFYLTPQQEGTVSGEVTITYEDSSLNKRTVTVPFTTQAAMAVMPTDGMDNMGLMDETEPAAPTGGAWWYWAVLGAAAVGGIAYAVVKKRKKASVEQDEDL